MIKAYLAPPQPDQEEEDAVDDAERHEEADAAIREMALAKITMED